MLKTNVDKIIEVLEQKKKVEVGDLAKELGTTKDNVLETAKHLEETGKVHVQYGLMKQYVEIVESKEQTNDKKQEQDLQINSSLMQVDIPEVEHKDALGKYSRLDHEEVTQAEFPQNITSLKPKEQTKDQEKPQIVYTVPLAAQNQQTPESQQAPQNLGQEYAQVQPQVAITQDLGNSKHQETDHVDDGLAYIPMIQTGVSQVSDSKILDSSSVEQMIDEAHRMLDEEKLDEANEFYGQIYDKFRSLDNIEVFERALLENKLAILFNRLKSCFVDRKI